MHSSRITNRFEKHLHSLRHAPKLKGLGVSSSLKVNGKSAAAGLLGGFLAISILGALTTMTSSEWLIAPFGASCVLAFGASNSPFSRPYNIVGGHMISAFISLLICQFVGTSYWSIGLAVGLSIAALILTGTTHPPAGATSLIVMMGNYDWSFLFLPVLTGSVLIVILAMLLNNLFGDRQYPIFWV